ncbi:MAG: TetR/AcrR family transcriptional regulator [Phenylobacterium sp.]|uniref:TetR/AcrR family transcriptional regulator n=1 Tax=Phenylobacterium sp. TaxID=1871053 RepID=UPI002733E115|nr:TetR/AcrR family transcriptional regulator [Phenylobacterium sp.]MDP3746197.1 TetR/AcrR family transcriptional regulator [Phenylobacterium sp.]
MPRLAGQIDPAKTEAILDAAAMVFGERGLSASMDQVARRAGVSKQTVYNRYGSKAELMRAIVARRVAEITAPLLVPGAEEHPEEALAAFGRVMIEAVMKPRGTSMLRMTVQGAIDLPDLARAFYEAGPVTSRRRLARFLEFETAAGRMAVDDPALAAEFFAGMVIGVHQIAHLLGVGRDLEAGEIDRIACEAARRFMKAYAD